MSADSHISCGSLLVLLKSTEGIGFIQVHKYWLLMTYHILVLEENEVLRVAVTKMITSRGWSPISVEHIHLAMGAIEGVQFDIVVAGLINYNEEVTNLFCKVRELSPSTRLISGAEFRLNNQGLLALDQYINFPFSINQLQHVIHDVLSM